MASGSAVPARPKSHAQLVDAEDGSVRELPHQLSGLGQDATRWIPVGTCLAHFDCPTWLHVMHQLILHPERNSSNILRADILCESDQASNCPSFRSQTTIRRRILPRRPNLDGALLQDCTTYDDGAGSGLVVYTPLMPDGSLPSDPARIPFFHPNVRAIAFAFRAQSAVNVAASSSADSGVLGRLVIYIVPFACNADFNAVHHTSHRLSRTVLSLLETQAQHSWGSRHNYQKRITHDTLVPREEYMDLYLALKEKHAGRIVAHWVESTDARKHVYEDIGIATFLILLWEKTVEAGGTQPTSFVDVGCGNGLLVHLLNAEGHTGFGFDLQARKSWPVWQSLPGGADLRVVSLDAPAIVQEGQTMFPPSSFLIGNHADELTSWLPLLAHSVPQACGFVNIPCCLFQLDGTHFGNTKYPLSDEQISALLGQQRESQATQRTSREFQRGPPTQSAASTSRNVAYLKYVSHLHLQAGWHLEKEALRIPSTKNWALVGRRRVWQSLNVGAEGDEPSRAAVSALEADVDAAVQRLTAQAGPHWKARLPPGGTPRSH